MQVDDVCEFVHKYLLHLVVHCWLLSIILIITIVGCKCPPAMGISVPSVSDTIQGNLHSETKRLIEDKVIKELPHVDITFIYTIEIESPVQLWIGQIFTLLHVCNSSVKLQSGTFQTFGSIQKLIKG